MTVSGQNAWPRGVARLPIQMIKICDKVCSKTMTHPLVLDTPRELLRCARPYVEFDLCAAGSVCASGTFLHIPYIANSKKNFAWHGD